MKTHILFALAALALALFGNGSAMANEPQWQIIDNHHGSYLYVPRPAPTGTTIAFVGHTKGLGSTTTTVKRAGSSRTEAKPGYRELTSPHGTVIYFAPAE